MDAAVERSLDGILILNVSLALICFVAVVSVAVAVWLDLRERRRWRSIVPPCWPPPGVDPEAAYAEDLVQFASGPSRPVSIHEGDEQ